MSKKHFKSSRTENDNYGQFNKLMPPKFNITQLGVTLDISSNLKRFESNKPVKVYTDDWY